MPSGEACFEGCSILSYLDRGAVDTTSVVSCRLHYFDHLACGVDPVNPSVEKTVEDYFVPFQRGTIHHLVVLSKYIKSQ